MSDCYAPQGEVRLKRGREASVLRGHPWVYRGALGGAGLEFTGPVLVLTASGAPLGVAMPGGSGGSLALRMLTSGEENWSRETLVSRVRAAVELRHRVAIDADAYRLLHAEGDRFPGLVADWYAGVVVVQLYEPGWQPFLADLTAALAELTGARTVLLRRGDARTSSPGVLLGSAPEEPVTIREGVAHYPVDLVAGQKTGFFLDQRENRRRLGELAAGSSVLNLFSYSGGFAVAALLGGAARAVNVDASAPALALARRAYRLNGLDETAESFVAGDAFVVSRELAAAGQRFDVVVVDPPAFVKRQADLRRGLQGYRDINLQALRLLAPQGLLLTCSCSALLDETTFGQMLQAAAIDAGRHVRVLERRGAGPDHPVALACPETRHLKVFLCAVA